MTEGTEKLIAAVYNSVLEGGEVATKEKIISMAVDLETEEGLEFEARDIITAYYEGNESAIDAFIENAESTPDSEWDAEGKADYIDEMKTQLPTNLRKQSLKDALAAF
jgi:hypothetical protein